MTVSCIHCQSKNLMRNKRKNVDRQQYKCKDCCRWFTLNPKRIRDDYRRCPRKYVCVSPAPEGQVYHTNNLAAFCREHNLIQTCMFAVLNGSNSQHKGWKCFYEEEVE